MQTIRNGSRRSAGYVCLSCRIKSQSRSIVSTSRRRNTSDSRDGGGEESILPHHNAMPNSSGVLEKPQQNARQNSIFRTVLKDPIEDGDKSIRAIRKTKGDSPLNNRKEGAVYSTHMTGMKKEIRKPQLKISYPSGPVNTNPDKIRYSPGPSNTNPDGAHETRLNIRTHSMPPDIKTAEAGPNVRNPRKVIDAAPDRVVDVFAAQRAPAIPGPVDEAEPGSKKDRSRILPRRQWGTSLREKREEQAKDETIEDLIGLHLTKRSSEGPAETAPSNTDIVEPNPEASDYMETYKPIVEPDTANMAEASSIPAQVIDTGVDSISVDDVPPTKPKKLEWNEEMIEHYRLATQRLVEEWKAEMASRPHTSAASLDEDFSTGTSNEMRDEETDADGGLSLADVMAAHPAVQYNKVRPTLRAAPWSASTPGRDLSLSRPSLSPSNMYGQQARPLHTARKSAQQAAAISYTPDFEPLPPPPSLDKISKRDSPIRVQLRQWQELHGNKEDPNDQYDHDRDRDSDDLAAPNALTRLPNDQTSFHNQELEEEEEQQALNAFMRSSSRDMDSATQDSRWLKMGDLVELEFPRTERESIIAVFVRRVGFESQFYTMNGRWVHMPERHIQYSIPGWISPELVEPLLPYLPDPQTMLEKEKLDEEAFVLDLSVPRAVSAGLINRMVKFNAESQEIYRRNASALDNAHDILAHETDLRYGSLLSATVTLLKMKESELPVTALFTVRKALARAGFAFNVDRRSHRLTGYLQIRSKQQLQMVEEVRGWMRDWQDDLATRSALQGAENERKLRRHRTPRTAQYVYDFVEKAKKIVSKSRENRDPTAHGSIGPSKTRLPLTPTSQSVNVTVDEQFTKQEQDILKFFEAWACCNMFLGLPRIEALPPLLLHAVGMYEELGHVGLSTGILFLQELGTIMPYENRVKFDQHLLLPSSQHSKPLQNLMNVIQKMKDDHEFHDSMRDLRHDWGNLAVYCIDDAGAHEIDDGISVEKAATGEEEWWVHIHIANPTAFLSRESPLAKMARHMGESIYMPERAYMMIPRWATSRYFSLNKNRPSLTFSVRLDTDGRVLERKVRSGIVRNVFRLTGPEVEKAMGHETESSKELELTVGGEPPPPPKRRSALADLTEENAAELKVLQRLAAKRSAIRHDAGGVFFDEDKPEVEIWQNWTRPGLAWEHPYRQGARTVVGDPIIRLRTKGLRNWFEPTSNDSARALVREMMLLACETAAAWCAERQIPTIFRGTARRPDRPDPDVFFRDVLKPAAEKTPNGAYPLHLGIQYVASKGNTTLSSKPLHHSVIGMDYYGKVTSPLRRYGDMILHWQIEAALREEARTGESLATQDPNVDRSFLPFSANVLDTIMLGLQPREGMVQRAKSYSLNFWMAMLMFRAFHYGEAELPFWTEASPTNPDGTVKPRMRLFVHSTSYTHTWAVNTINVELNLNCSMLRPEIFGMEEVRLGDIWEGELEHVNVYKRGMVCKPVRLAHREEVGAHEMKMKL